MIEGLALSFGLAASCASCCLFPTTETIMTTEYGRLEAIEVAKDEPYRIANTDDRKLPRSFDLLSWNGLAGDRKLGKNLAGLKLKAFECGPEIWNDVFVELAERKDLVLIQEAYLDGAFLKTIGGLDDRRSWAMARSYVTDGNVPNGVATISVAEARSAYPILAREALLPTPKAALLTTYCFEGDDSARLLVVNIHAVLSGSANYRTQLRNIKDEIDKHDGPVILAGDFNSFSKARAGELDILTQGPAALDEIRFEGDEDARVRLFGRPVDYVFYRGLIPEHAQIVDLDDRASGKVSDHNPIIVGFLMPAGTDSEAVPRD